MKQILTFAGTGSAFTMDNFQSNAILETIDDVNKEHRILLIDCGSDARFSLKEIGKSYADIHGVYISHLHADHIGGLEWLALSTYFNPKTHKPRLYISEKLVQPLWDSLKGGLGTLQNKVANLQTFFYVKPIQKNKDFIFFGTPFTMVQVIHYYDGFESACSYGLIWKTPDGKKIFYTSDTQHAPNQIKDFYASADIIFQDCETSPYPSGVHAHYDELKELKDEVRAKMWLYHYQDGELPDAKADGFSGFIEKGKQFTWTD